MDIGLSKREKTERKEGKSMSDSFARLDFENNIRLLFFKHRGDLPAIIKDLRDRYAENVENFDERITVAYVKKIIDKFKRQQKKNCPYVATNIMDYVLMGTKQREQLWSVDNQELEEFRYYYLSGCCDARTKAQIDSKGETVFTCLKCDKICQGYRMPDFRVFELQRKLRVEKRKDEECLVKAVDSLGFGQEKVPVMKNYYNQVIATGPGVKQVTSKEIKGLPVGAQQLIENIDSMDARDRESVRKQLEGVRRKIQGDGWPKEETS